MLFKALAVVLLLNAVHLSCQQTDEEIAENSVYVQFDKNEGDLLELTEWEDNMSTAKFRDITASVASSYCRNSTNDCNLRNLTSDFGSGDVMLDGEEEFFNGDIRLKVYISLTGKSLKDEDMLVIPKDSLIEILKMGKPTYDTGLTEPGMDYNITLMFVNEERVAPPADGSINTIMIIVSVLILLSAVLLAIVLKCKESMEEKKQLEQATGGRNQESVTLTDMKPKVEEDGAEGRSKRKSSKRKRVGPNTTNNNNVRSQETQTTARVVYIHDPNAATPSDPRGSIPTPREVAPLQLTSQQPVVGSKFPGANSSDETYILKGHRNPDGTGIPEYGSIAPKTEGGVTGVCNPLGREIVVTSGGGEHPLGVEEHPLGVGAHPLGIQERPLGVEGQPFDGGEGVTAAYVHGNEGDGVVGHRQIGKKASRHNILPPLAEGPIQDLSGDISGDLAIPAPGGMDGSEGGDKPRKKKHTKGNKKQKGGDKNGLLTRSLSPLDEEPLSL